MRTTLDKDRTLEDLRGSFKYGGILAGVVDVLVGVLVTFHFMEGADLNNGQSQIILILIGLICSVIAFFCGAKYRADKNKDQLVDNAQALINTYKAAAEKTESDRNGEIARLIELHQHEIQELNSEHQASMSEAKANYAISLAEKDALIGRLTTSLESEKSRTKEDVYETLCDVLDSYVLKPQVEGLTINDLRDVVQAATDKLVTVEDECLRIGDRIISTADDHDIKGLFKPAEGE